MSAIMGTFVKIGTMADGTPRLVLDLQCTLSEVAAMGLIPGVPFALARLEKQAAGKPVAPQESKEKAGELCIMACTFCADPLFWEWAGWADDAFITSESEAKQFILDVCEIDSRKKLDDFSSAARTFHNEIRKPFLNWKAKRSARLEFPEAK